MKKLLVSLLIISSLGFAGCSNAIVKAPVSQSTAVTTEQSQTSNLQYYFTKAGQHPDQQLIKIIDSSKNTLDIAIYSITKQSIIDAILSAKNRGVIVRLMTDKIESKSKSESKELVLLKAAGIPIKINSHAGLLHIKMTVADKSIGTTGSYNYTENASTVNDEILVVINDPNVAQDFDNEFENMWNNTKEYQDYK